MLFRFQFLTVLSVRMTDGRLVDVNRLLKGDYTALYYRRNVLLQN
jgi:hypothetical protein